jgi:hypothetical protein
MRVFSQFKLKEIYIMSNFFGSMLDFMNFDESSVCWLGIMDEVMEVQTMSGRGRGRARRAVKQQVLGFMLRCTSIQNALPKKVKDSNGNMVTNPEWTEWQDWKRDCKNQYDALLEAKEDMKYEIESPW